MRRPPGVSTFTLVRLACGRRIRFRELFMRYTRATCARHGCAHFALYYDINMMLHRDVYIQKAPRYVHYK